MEKLREAIQRLEPRIDLLHDCLGFGRFAEVQVTSDGWFLGRARGDIGCNAFLGRPSSAAITRARNIYDRLDTALQKELIQELASRSIPAALIGLPGDAAQGVT